MRHALNRFLPEMKISEVHGQAFHQEIWGNQYNLLALYHPAAALYNGAMRTTLIDDFKKIPLILKKISEETMTAIRKEYSKQCWNEATEELSVIYNTAQIAAIKNLFAGCDVIITREKLFQRATDIWSADPELKHILIGFDDLLRMLYTIGIIGNYRYAEKAYFRWYCRGDEALILRQDLYIHRIFWSVLSVVHRDRMY